MQQIEFDFKKKICVQYIKNFIEMISCLLKTQKTIQWSSIMIMKKLNLHKWLHLTGSILVLEFKTAAVFTIFEVNLTDQSCI